MSRPCSNNPSPMLMQETIIKLSGLHKTHTNTDTHAKKKVGRHDQEEERDESRKGPSWEEGGAH